MLRFPNPIHYIQNLSGQLLDPGLIAIVLLIAPKNQPKWQYVALLETHNTRTSCHFVTILSQEVVEVLVFYIILLK